MRLHNNNSISLHFRFCWSKYPAEELKYGANSMLGIIKWNLIYMHNKLSYGRETARCTLQYSNLMTGL